MMSIDTQVILGTEYDTFAFCYYDVINKRFTENLPGDHISQPSTVSFVVLENQSLQA